MYHYKGRINTNDSEHMDVWKVRSLETTDVKISV
jgi:hypothetical protein